MKHKQTKNIGKTNNVRCHILACTKATRKREEVGKRTEMDSTMDMFRCRYFHYAYQCRINSEIEETYAIGPALQGASKLLY